MTDSGKLLPEYSLRRLCDELEYLQRDVKQKVCCALMGASRPQQSVARFAKTTECFYSSRLERYPSYKKYRGLVTVI